MNCLACNNQNIVPILSLGVQPLANNLVSQEMLQQTPSTEPKYPLDLVFCMNCNLVQLSEPSIVPREILFKHYLYASSTAASFRKHFADFASVIVKKFNLSDKSLVVDIGSNDGVLLKPLKELGITAVGVEPATNLADEANKNGLETVNRFFDPVTAALIISQRDQADVITASNVFAHMIDVNDFIESVKILLKKNGVFVIEVQYLGDMIKNMTFDNIYHEHTFYYTLTSLRNLFESHYMYIFDVEHVETHGGSLRVYVSSQKTESIEVSLLLAKEAAEGLTTLFPYANFGKKLERFRENFKTFLLGLKTDNDFVIGYGYPAKASTLLNYVGIGTEVFSYIIDDSPLKQGLYSPGLHIPIKPVSELENKVPDVIVVLAWNFADAIIEKCKKYKEQGTSFVIPLPSPRLV